VDEGLSHIDIRLISGSIKDDNKDSLSDSKVVKIIEKCVNQIRITREPNFTFSLIYMGVKSMDDTIEVNLECAFKISKEFPHLEVGYDLVENEDNYKTQWDLRDLLVNKYNEYEKKYGSHVHYVFHAGETNNIDNTNIVDCLLLGTKRIGHGFNLFRQ